MFRLFLFVFLLFFVASVRAAEPAAPPAAATFLAQYCTKCHDAKQHKGDRRFDNLALTLGTPAALATWQDIIDQINLGEMPPPKEPGQPPAAQVREFVNGVTTALAEGRAARRGADMPSSVRRMNRLEYVNTLRDLLHLDMTEFNPTLGFPADETEDGFDNLGDTLTTSSFLLNHYLAAADAAVEKAVHFEPQPPQKKYHFASPFDKTTRQWVLRERQLNLGYQQIWEGPKDTWGHISLDDLAEGVPADGEYLVRVKACGIDRQHPYDKEIVGTDTAEPIRLALVAGARKFGPLNRHQPGDMTVAEFDLPDDTPQWLEAHVWLDAGFQPRLIYPNGPFRMKALANILPRRHPDLLTADKRYAGPWTDMVKEFHTPRVRIFEVEIEGPLYKSWPPASHVALFGSMPFTPERTAELVSRFASAAFRRPARSGELASLMKVVQVRRAAGDTPLDATKAAFKATLCSPGFLYIDAGKAAVEEKTTDYALASRLSYFLWSSMPDQPLLAAAAKGELRKSPALLEQTRRMLADPKSRAFVQHFTDRWLTLYKMGEMPPDPKAFQVYYTQDLEPAMKEESRQFFQYLLEKNLKIENFLNSNFTFVDGRLARLYGIPGVTGTKFQKVAVNDPRRGGLLGQASVLTVTANGVDTSPVLRGVWVLSNILGTPPAPPPPDVPPVEPDIRGATTIRQQLEKHRSSATCYECHRKIDPLGFALESFNAIGVLRNHYDEHGRQAVDTTGTLPDGKPFKNVAELKQLLVAQPTLFERNLTSKLLTYALGRQLTPADRPQIDSIVGRLHEKGNGLADLVLLIVESEAFQRPAGG